MTLKIESLVELADAINARYGDMGWKASVDESSDDVKVFSARNVFYGWQLVWLMKIAKRFDLMIVTDYDRRPYILLWNAHK